MYLRNLFLKIRMYIYIIHVVIYIIHVIYIEKTKACLLVAGSVRSTCVQTEMTTICCFSTFGRLLTANLNVLSSKRSGKNLSLSLKAAVFRPVAEFPVSSARLRDAKMRNKVKLKGEREREREEERERNSASDPHPLQDISHV